MKLIQVKNGLFFSYNGNVLTHDLIGRNGGRMIAVRNVKTGKQMKLSATTEVELVEADIIEEVSEETILDGEVDIDDLVPDNESQGFAKVENEKPIRGLAGDDITYNEDPSVGFSNFLKEE